MELSLYTPMRLRGFSRDKIYLFNYKCPINKKKAPTLKITAISFTDSFTYVLIILEVFFFVFLFLDRARENIVQARNVYKPKLDP